MSNEILLVLCTCPDQASAENIAERLVSGHMAACVNITQPVTSVYQWKGQIEHAEELILLIKTTKDAYPVLEAEIREQHPYDLPEIIAIPLERGLPEYLKWVQQCTETN